MHVNFIGADADVHELYIAPGSSWVDNNLGIRVALSSYRPDADRLVTHLVPNTVLSEQVEAASVRQVGACGCSTRATLRRGKRDHSA